MELACLHPIQSCLFFNASQYVLGSYNHLTYIFLYTIYVHCVILIIYQGFFFQICEVCGLPIFQKRIKPSLATCQKTKQDLEKNFVIC